MRSMRRDHVVDGPTEPFRAHTTPVLSLRAVESARSRWERARNGGDGRWAQPSMLNPTIRVGLYERIAVRPRFLKLVMAPSAQEPDKAKLKPRDCTRCSAFWVK